MVLGRLRFSIEVPGLDVVVETDIVDTAELGYDFHDICLLLG